MTPKPATWCERDMHVEYERFEDFNDWLSSDDAKDVRLALQIDAISDPSKALFAGDRVSYDQTLAQYRTARWFEVLGQACLDEHWYERNEQRFEQLVQALSKNVVVPFIGAGLSKAGGFPTWKEHLRQQGKTAGLDAARIDDLLSKGEYESVIDEVERERGGAVFAQEIRDVFGKDGNLTNAALQVSELFQNAVITTNYDRLLEQAYKSRGTSYRVAYGKDAQPGIAADSVAIIKLHGDIKNPLRCIIGKKQYDQVYGTGPLDMRLPIPRTISHYYVTNSLLFMGCSLTNDRTVQVCNAIRQSLGDVDRPQHFAIEQAPDNERQFVERNAFLAGLGITVIWFERGNFDYVDKILELSRDELRHRGFLQAWDACRGEVSRRPDSILSHWFHKFVEWSRLRGRRIISAGN